jgi:hypothetical protein
MTKQTHIEERLALAGKICSIGFIVFATLAGLCSVALSLLG